MNRFIPYIRTSGYRAFTLLGGVAAMAVAGHGDTIQNYLLNAPINQAVASSCNGCGSSPAVVGFQVGTDPALAEQGGGYAMGAAFAGSNILPSANIQGYNSFLYAESSDTNAIQQAFAVVQYQVSSPGQFVLSFRGGAADELPGSAEWDIQLGPSVPQMVETVDTSTNTIYNIVEPASTGVCNGCPYADVSGYSESGTNIYTGAQTPISSGGSEQSNLMPLGVALTDSDIEDSISFNSPGNSFFLLMTVYAHGGLAFVDPTITPAPSNPNIVVTSSAGLNPTPDVPLIPSSAFQGLTSDELAALAAIGIPAPSGASVPEASPAMMAGIGLLLLTAFRRACGRVRP
jgi:hypothetical protein